MEHATAGYRVQGMTGVHVAGCFVQLFLHSATALLPDGEETHFPSPNHHTCFKIVPDLRGGIEIPD